MEASNYINYVGLHYVGYYGVTLHVNFVVKHLCFYHTQEWFTVFEQYRRTNCVVSDLIMGNEFVFRVFTNNLVGSSQEPCTSKDSALIQKIGETSAISTLLISPAAKKNLLTVAPLRYGIQAAHAQGSRLLAGSQVHAPSGEPLCHCGIQCHPQLFRQRHTQGQFIVIKNERSNRTKLFF